VWMRRMRAGLVGSLRRRVCCRCGLLHILGTLPLLLALTGRKAPSQILGRPGLNFSTRGWRLKLKMRGAGRSHWGRSYRRPIQKSGAIAIARGQKRVRTEINVKRVGPRAVCHVSRADFDEGARLKAAQRALCAPCLR
jgi:hypothetical protein